MHRMHDGRFMTSASYFCLLCRCANAEAYVVERLPVWMGDPGTAAKATAIADYYLLGQGSVPDLAQSVAGVNISGVLAQINATRDQAVQARAPPAALPGPISPLLLSHHLADPGHHQHSISSSDIAPGSTGVSSSTGQAGNKEGDTRSVPSTTPDLLPRCSMSQRCTAIRRPWVVSS